MAEEIKDEIVLNDDELICVLTGNKKKANAKELMLQSVILQMNEEYGFEMSDMKRDFTFSFQDEEDKRKRVSVDLAIFRAGATKEPENLERILTQALNRALICSSDPLCSEHDPSEDRSLHQAACHACSFVSETSCEKGNRYLDRGYLVPTYETADTGFFNDLFQK